ncbi:helix-turn-helix domain-containing protein [Mumia sp. zg.B53]|uniref:helix-turn-helix domain-containing protein n=1 Tax=Mumia sp. TaxID=1965300 RepID=UPI001C6E2F23|nr:MULTISPECIES: helix-turn-helix transcriptional regulator [unclassified Mumia]MBW9207415.1 helix-turn-helix domain-containing protein [Mumia sp. zg.B17]MBW9210244.1 helix-turn-helix domain-containing protein [Mumia sp. zg.B21]MBW9214854.1 helix-turn-helix domain-containing protein [Mumia sp. zg.B53]
MLRHALGDALRDERQARGRTLRDVAKSSQVSLAYLSEIERGQKEASSEIIAAVSTALGITMLDLVASVARTYAVHEGHGAMRAAGGPCPVAIAA